LLGAGPVLGGAKTLAVIAGASASAVQARTFCRVYSETFRDYTAFAGGQYYGVESVVSGQPAGLHVHRFPLMREQYVESRVMGYDVGREGTEVLVSINRPDGSQPPWLRRVSELRLELRFDTGQRYEVPAQFVRRLGRPIKKVSPAGGEYDQASAAFDALAIAAVPPDVARSVNTPSGYATGAIVPKPIYDLQDRSPQYVDGIVAAARAASSVEIVVRHSETGEALLTARQPLAGFSKGLDTAKAQNEGVLRAAQSEGCYVFRAKQPLDSVPVPYLCFLTTACCDAVGLPDDCWELTQARRFRDGWLAVQPGGRSVIDEYYAIAPRIVAAMNRLPDARQRWLRLYRANVLPFVLLARLGLNRLAYHRYRRMVASLRRLVEVGEA
jgi:hypothetical protein